MNQASHRHATAVRFAGPASTAVLAAAVVLLAGSATATQPSPAFKRLAPRAPRPAPDILFEMDVTAAVRP
jgi:hypothetical protein